MERPNISKVIASTTTILSDICLTLVKPFKCQKNLNAKLLVTKLASKATTSPAMLLNKKADT